MAFRNPVRMNPTHATAEKPIGVTAPPEARQIGAGGFGGSLYAHLGHFAGPSVITKGHNTSGHMGFKAAASSVQKKEGVSKASANRIIAAGARNASAKAKRRNPRLRRVKG